MKTALCAETCSAFGSKMVGIFLNSILLEAQQLSNVEQKKVFDFEVEELIGKMPKELWDDHNELLLFFIGELNNPRADDLKL